MQNLISKIQSISLKNAFLWIFLFGNIALGFINSSLRMLVKYLHGNSFFWSWVFVIVIGAYSVFSLWLVYKKRNTAIRVKPKFITICVWSYAVLWAIFFLFLGMISPLTFVGTSIFGGIFKGNWGFSVFTTTYHWLVHQQ